MKLICYRKFHHLQAEGEGGSPGIYAMKEGVGSPGIYAMKGVVEAPAFMRRKGRLSAPRKSLDAHHAL
jgi:hypothetical protein